MTLVRGKSYDTFKQQYARRQRFNDSEYAAMTERLDHVIDMLGERNAKWHYSSCYATFANDTNIGRLQNPQHDETNSVHENQPRSKVTRRNVTPLKSDMCLICQVREPNLPNPCTLTGDKVEKTF